MKRLPTRRLMMRAATMGLVFTGLSATPALAAGPSQASPGLIQSLINTPTSTSGCTSPPLSQPFASAGDSNWYALLPGQAADGFAGSGWSLVGGARVVSATLADGQTGSVLDLPSGSVAISPVMCVQSDYTSIRAMVRELTGSGAVSVYVSYAGTNSWNMPLLTGQLTADGTEWTLSDPLAIAPSSNPGWQLARFGFVQSRQGEAELYKAEADPRMI